jgi:hypothetical protein
MGSSIPDPLAPDPMAAIDAMELAAWRIAQTARQLRRDHPHLPVHEMRPLGITDGRTALEINAGSHEGVLAWAQHLGTEPTRTSHPDTTNQVSFQHTQVTADITDVSVTVYAIQLVSPLTPAHAGPALAVGKGAGPHA